ncbi:MAG: hypothetical protein EOP10_00025 [Proteobacteria bacterium]|nr:MAG: hypothetical protein EOP10_00025 [Pseudomonadota bacterium]
MPTPTHHAIAQTVKAGLIKVIVTTNFDKLMEQALIMILIFPTVIASADSFKGASPLIHTDVAIVKINGDLLVSAS